MAQDNAAQSIKDLGKDLENLNKKIIESIKILESFDVDVADLFAKARESGIANTDKLVDYLAKRLSNLQLKNFSSPFLAAFDEKEIDRAAKKYAALLEKQDVVEKARSIAVGGRKFGELQGEDLKNWREFSSLLATINEQKKQIEQETAGAADAGKKLYDEQLAFKKAQEVQSQEKKRLAQEEVEAKRKAAEDEKQLIKEIKEEEKRAKEEALQRYKEEKAYLDDVEKRKHKTKESELKEAFGQQSKQKLESEMKMNKAVQQQITYYRQLHSLYKEYKALQAKPNKTKEDNAVLEQTKQKILEILRLSKQLELENKGSAAIAKQATEFERVRDRAREARGETQKMQKSLQNLLPTLQRLASAFGVAFSVRGLAQFGKKLIETRGEFEMQFVAMKQIIGDVDAATKIWNQTMQQALQSPFKAMQLVTYTKQLAAYRIETEKLFDTTKRLADISAGLGVDMGRLILAYGQVKSANFLRASEVRQFTEAGVNIAGQLAEYFSQIEGRAVSTAEVMERITKRMVSFADVEEIFKRMTDEGGQFYKMQEIQTDTVKGQIQKLHDAYDQMLNTIGQANQGTIRNLVDKLNDLVRNWRNIVPLIKSSVTVLGSYIAFTKLARMGVDRFGDSIVKFRLGKKKQTVEMQAAMVKETLLLNRQAKTITAWEYHTKKALFNVQMAWKALGSIMKSFAPFLAIEGVLYVYNKIMETRREEARLREDLANIRSENRSKADTDVGNYDKLIRRFNELNKGSIERKEIIDKLNSQYGKYLGFVVDEKTKYDDLANAQERVNLNIRERARLRAEEEAQQRIQEDYMQREAKLLKPKQAWGIQGVYSFLYNDPNKVSGKNTQWISDAEKFAEFAKTKINDLTDEELKSREELEKATALWLNTFYGVSGATDVSSGLVDLVELYAEQEKKLRDERIKLSEEFKALPEQLQKDLLAMESEWATAMQKLTKAGNGDEVEIPLLNVKLKVPTDLAEKSGVWEVIKEELNKRKEEFKINLKLEAGLITEEQAEELKKQGKSTGSIFIDAVNKELAENILKDAGIEKSFEELKNDIFYNPQNIDDWDKVNHVIELITGNLINASDIVNGTTSYTKELANNLQVARDAINDAVKAQELVADGTQKEKDDAQKLVDKTIERYKWLLKIAKLLGLDTKAADEIVAEQGYDLSVGQLRLAAAQQAFMEKFGVASNTYGKQLSKIGVTDNLKDVADAYHKQSEELDVLIRNQETALENETNLTEEQKKNAQTTIDNLKNEKSFAEFLATFFGYVPKKDTTRKTHENASKLISLIKEMRSEYDKLSKSAYGYAKSEEKVRDAYKDSVKEILGKAGITDYDFTTNEGMIAALEKVKTYATKLGKDAAAEVQKYIDQLETEIEINAQVRIREDFGKKIENAFNDYELTLELDKLNISPEAAKNLFPEFDSQTLGELQDAMQEFYRSQGENFDEEDLKVYKQWADKIEAEILKMRKERAKEYSKFLEKEYSDRAKLEMQYAKDVAFVTANFQGEQQQNILKGLEDKYQKDINELTWKSFKESAFYVEMMDDLSSIPAEYMKIMLGKIEELLENPETLSPRALKEAINARQKILEAQMDINSLAVMRQSTQDIREAANDVGGTTWMQTKKRLDEEQQAQAERLDVIEREIRANEILQGQLKGLEDVQQAEANARAALSSETNVELGELEDVQLLINEYQASLAVKTSQLENSADANSDSNAALEREISDLRIAIALLEEYNRAKQGRIAYEGTTEGQAAVAAQMGGQTSTSVGTRITRQRGEANNIQNRLSQLKQWQKAFKNFADSMAKWNGALADTINKIGSMGSAFYDTFEALGGETDALTEGWKEFGDTMVQTITQALALIPQLVTGFVTAGTSINAALGIIGLIAEAIQLVIVLIGALAKLHDAGYEAEIERQQEKIDALERAYSRLEKQIEKTWDTASYISTYNAETQNLYEQIEALNRQISAEEAKKNSDKDKIQGYKDAIVDIEDELEDLKQKQNEVFGGIGKDSYRSAAEEFVDAWKSAFLETGDGLQGLQDHFDEFLNDWFVKQATMRIAGSTLAPLFEKIDQAVDQYGFGGTSVTWQELSEINKLKELLLKQTDEQLRALASVFGLEGEGGLSGLAAGIQGMTEEQANILEAYWNSVRGYTENININVARLLSNDVNTNPMLQQITLVAQNTNSINTLLQSVTKSGHSMGGQGLKVFVN